MFGCVQGSQGVLANYSITYHDYAKNHASKKSCLSLLISSSPVTLNLGYVPFFRYFHQLTVSCILYTCRDLQTALYSFSVKRRCNQKHIPFKGLQTHVLNIHGRGKTPFGRLKTRFGSLKNAVSFWFLPFPLVTTKMQSLEKDAVKTFFVY